MRRAFALAALGFTLTLSAWLFLGVSAPPDAAQQLLETLPAPAPAVRPARRAPVLQAPRSSRQAGSIPSEQEWNTG